LIARKISNGLSFLAVNRNFYKAIVLVPSGADLAEFLVSAGTDLAVKLLTALQLWALMRAHYFLSFFGEEFLQEFLSNFSV